MRISSEEEFDMFKQLLALVDDRVREVRMPNRQALELLMSVLAEQFLDSSVHKKPQHNGWVL
jgi:hypothetical protein